MTTLQAHDSVGMISRRRPTRGAVLAMATTLLATLALLAPASAPAGALDLASPPDLAAAAQALGVNASDLTAQPAAAGAVLSGPRAASVRAQADGVRRRAGAAQRAHLFTRATTLYIRARGLYLEAGATRPARACLSAVQDIFLITATYSYDRTEMLTMLAETYPDTSAEQRVAWLDLPSTERMRWDGVTHYFYDLPINLAYRDVALFQSQPELVAAYRGIYDELVPYLAVAAETPAWRQYGVPKAYDFVQTLAVPRDELPSDGALRIWFPLPIEVGPQTGVRITEIAPTTYLRYPPSTTQDIGLLFMRVPLQELAGDLDASFRVQYTHAAQYFKVDPAKVGRYNTNGALYRRYTASHGNTQITPSIRRTARRVVGAETNPYLAAQRLYEYVITHVTYSHMPHFAMWPRGQAESIYVHERKYGDCGAQSMYFAALCRSVGIPARCTGGFQTFSGVPAGHFWAEFYLPNYGWVPVDPTAATIADYLPGLPPTDRQAFHDFYFANQDDLRLVVQKDTDLPLIPRADERVLLPLAIQMPAALCDTMTEIPGLVLMEHWTFD